MNKGNLSTESYKGVRDFYPEDMAVQRYIFDTWAKTAESFGYERYDASILEPSDLYRSKGAVNEEMVNEQTYTFTDRGEREVTLRPEMTPTVARMVAGKRRELKFPLRWYSIPNLFRYERPQRGRLREHWQLNCDMFGADDFTADVELIALTHQLFLDFGATPDMFEIRVNDRQEMSALYNSLGIKDQSVITAITRLNDRKNKITGAEYETALEEIIGDTKLTKAVITIVEDTTGTNQVIDGLRELGIYNVRLDRTIARGFDYYTGTVFEVFDTSPENNRSMCGGGRYNNLTAMFSDDTISGIGFGMGDVIMRDFLETHKLLPTHITETAPCVVIIPTDQKLNLEAQKVAHAIRIRGISTTTDIGTKKIGKKIADAVDRGARYTIVVGSDELQSGAFTLKNLAQTTEITDSLENLLTHLITNN
ncbi:histidine--tRNA ligase [Candidatus Kaiserbacteria bacterium RIFCSPLOWO2_02_FULL_45_11b]|uniref:Histidine--tRNA ligase n=1 Tax=Candidatus Kaiserbacteria bacterium RIFCSPLOWO2_12_FULL_45_26 TaxID=1798525 RepID=A0A1F6FHH5_9BACT|nr:MAG: histidine--tRNA ligase [Candidatus Kaiserbacteria bacterium RIFCSPLOWO2_01_FULL_45_25]OGG83772.1 MAG: histidine--tRNA ligase [Candidatus Kaiserbacteria bacterium RIFCSPLOWO2_02_FULL_45_11b]OGG85266.1 MAG: histidine--tRNA ligase [Candidatus Kaiserbacteria bacterium RIFCSPLOWO2_12_FULL_45_26]